ncbi:DUF659 domain-containing protein [Arachis hypogaea]|nr:DUF659 domain-containing protein [Arachis hypogaea]
MIGGRPEGDARGDEVVGDVGLLLQEFDLVHSAPASIHPPRPPLPPTAIHSSRDHHRPSPPPRRRTSLSPPPRRRTSLSPPPHSPPTTIHSSRNHHRPSPPPYEFARLFYAAFLILDFDFLRWNNHKVTHSHKIMLFKILKLVHPEVNLIQFGKEEGEAPNPVQPPAPATMGDKGKRRAIAAIPIGSYFKERTTTGSQPTLKSVLASKQVKHKVKLGLARWIIDAQIPFNAIQSPYFQPALDGVAAIGPGFKGPSYDEMRVHLLADLKKECQLPVEGYRSSWKRTGCTLIADGWTDQRQRILINFLVYCPAGIKG